MKKSVTVRRRHANKLLSSRQVKKVVGGGADKLLVARPAQSTLCMLRFVSENFTPSCLHCNFFVPKLIAIILAEYYTQQQLQLGVHVCILFPFMAVLCMLALACSVNIQS